MFLVKQFTDQCIEFVGTRDEIRRQVLAHERNMWLLTTSIQVVDKLLPFMVEVVEVCAAHPVRQAGEVKVRRTLDRIDAYPLLPRISPLLAHHLRPHGRGRHHQHHELDDVERLGNLQPPVPATFHADAILPERNMLSLQPFPQLRSEMFSIRASIGDKDARRNAGVRARLPACRHPGPLREVMGMCHVFDVPPVYTTPARLHSSYYSTRNISSCPYPPLPRGIKWLLIRAQKSCFSLV